MWSLPVTWQRWRSQHSIRNFWNPLLYANLTVISFIEPELLPIKILHCGNSEIRVFFAKIVENITMFFSYRTSDTDDAETHFLVHYRQFQLLCCLSYTHSRCFFTPDRLVTSFPVTWQRWRSHHSIPNFWKPLLYANFTALSEAARNHLFQGRRSKSMEDPHIWPLTARKPLNRFR